MKKSILISILSLIAIVLFGCSTEKVIKVDEVKANTILIKNDGTIQAATVETFEKDYYNSTELETFITEKITEYNSTDTAEAITLGSLKVDNGNAILLLNYANLNAYNGFNESNVVFTSATEAKTGENILPEVFVSASNGAYVAPDVALKNDKYKVIILKDNTELVVDGKIKYFTNGKLISKSKFQASGENESVVIYKP
jgi:hypothetical protein